MTYLLGRSGETALSVAAAHIDPTYKEMIEALPVHFGTSHMENLTAQLSTHTLKWSEF